MGKTREGKGENPQGVTHQLRGVGKCHQWVLSCKAHLPQTFAEYCSLRKSKHRYWSRQFRELLEVVKPAHPVGLDASVNAQLENLGLSPDDMTFAEHVINYYNNQLGSGLGGLEFLDTVLIPKNLVQPINKAKVHGHA